MPKSKHGTNKVLEYSKLVCKNIMTFVTYCMLDAEISLLLHNLSVGSDEFTDTNICVKQTEFSSRFEYCSMYYATY